MDICIFFQKRRTEIELSLYLQINKPFRQRGIVDNQNPLAVLASGAVHKRRRNFWAVFDTPSPMSEF